MINSNLIPHIAIIDDGVSNEEKIYASPLNNIIIKNGAIKKHLQKSSSHGSICASIISAYAEKYNLSSIKILHGGKAVGDISDLVCAIEWCIRNHVDIINLSLGSDNTQDYADIYKIVNKAVYNNIIIVAAQNNNGKFTLPACLPNVIGVRHSDLLNVGKYTLRRNPFDGIDILTSSKHLIRKKNNKTILTGSNSFATPFVTALASGILSKYGKMNIENMILHLEEKASLIRNRQMENWDYERYSISKISQIPYLQSMIETPILFFQGSNAKVDLDNINKIVDQIINDNHYPYVISNTVFNYSFNIDILPKNLSLDEYVNAVSFKKKPDVLLVYCEKTKLKTHIVPYLEVSFLKDFFYINIGNETLKIEMCDDCFVDKILEFLY